MSTFENYATTKEAAEILGKSEECVRHYIRSGQLEAIDERGRKYILRADLEHFAPRPRGNPNLQKDSKS
ncbi:hypothetical protein GCM10023155_50900 [Bremerella cremea]